MADAYGNINGSWRAHVKAWVSEQTDTECTITCAAYIQSLGESFTVSANGTADVAGTSSSATISFTATSGVNTDKSIVSVKKTFQRTSKASTQTCKVTVAVPNGYNAGSSETSVDVTVPAIVHKEPRPVKNLNLVTSYEGSDTPEYVSTLTWENDADDSKTGVRPYDGIRVTRTFEGGIIGLADLAGTATSFTDTATGYGSAYYYSIVPYNDAGQNSTSTDTVYMQPAKITDFSVTRLSATSARLNFTGCYYATEYQLYVSGDHSVVTFDPPQGEDGYVWNDVPTGETLSLQVRGRRGSWWTSGPWSNAVTMGPLSAPGAPAVDSLETVYVTGTELTIKWTPSHPDCSEQSLAEVAITTPSGTETITVQGSTTETTYTCSEKGTVSVTVRTKGLLDTWGARSAAATFTVADNPVVTFTSPKSDGAEIHGLPLEVKWNVTDTTGVSSQSFAVMENAGGTVYTTTPKATDRSVSLSTASGIKDGKGYVIVLGVRNGAGLSASTRRNFIAKWTGPDAPTVKLSVNGYAVTVTATAATTGDVKTASLSVARQWTDTAGVQKKVLATGLKSGASVRDPLPPLGVEVTYIVTAVAPETGATTSTTKTVTVSAGGYEVYNFGENAGTVLALGLSASSSESIELTGETFDFADTDSGDGIQEFYADGGLTGSGTHSYNVLTRTEYETARRLSRTYPTCWYRSAWGDVQRCHVKFSFSYDADSYSLWGISASTDEITWKEPV